MEFFTSPSEPLPEISITHASIKHTATVIIVHIVPFALHDCLNSALLNKRSSYFFEPFIGFVFVLLAIFFILLLVSQYRFEMSLQRIGQLGNKFHVIIAQRVQKLRRFRRTDFNRRL